MQENLSQSLNRTEPLIPYARLTWWVLVLPVLMLVGLTIKSFYLLLLSHVMSGVLWTGADIFMGFILGPVWGHLDPRQRQAVQRQLVPKTFLYMPVLAITTGTAGWFVAQHDGFATAHSVMFPWVMAAGAVVVILSVVGLGVLLPTNLKVLQEVRKATPDAELLKRWTFRIRRLAAVQGLFQVIIMIIMAYLAIAP